MNLSDIIKRYKDMPDEQLLSLAKESHTLRPDVLPLLEKELQERKLLEEGAKLESLRLNDSIYKGLSLREIQEIVTQRLDSGESLESIKADLADHGIHSAEILDLLEADMLEKVNYVQAIQYAEESGANTKLKDLGYTEEDNQVIQKDAKSRIKIGNIFAIIFFVLLILKVILRIIR